MKRNSRESCHITATSFVPTSTIGYGQSSNEQVSFDDVAYDKMRERALHKLKLPNNSKMKAQNENYIPCPSEHVRGARVSRPFEYECDYQCRYVMDSSNTSVRPPSIDSPWCLDSPAETWTSNYQAQPFWF